MSFQAGLGHGIRAKLNRLKTKRNAAFRANGGRDLVPVKWDAIEDELAAPGMRLKVLQAGRKNLLATAYKAGLVTGKNPDWEDKIASARGFRLILPACSQPLFAKLWLDIHPCLHCGAASMYCRRRTQRHPAKHPKRCLVPVII
jgi:hypothetical protein